MPRGQSFSSFRAILIYILGAVCVLVTDAIFFEKTPGSLLHGLHLKGLFFIILSAAVLYGLLQKYRVSLCKSETAYFNVFQSNPDPMWIFRSTDYRVMEVNDAAISAYGYTRSEFKGMNILDLFASEDADRLIKEKDNLINEGSNTGFWRQLKKDGSPMYMDIQSFFAIKYKNQHAIVTSLKDVTNRLIANQAIVNQQRLYSTIINSTDDHIWAVDTDLRYLAFNDTFKNTVQSLTNTTIKENDPLTDRQEDPEYLERKRYYERALQGEKLMIEEVRKVRGCDVHVETTMVPILSENKIIGVACFARNVTARKEQEIQSKKMLERYDLLNLATNDVIWDWDFTCNNIIWNHNVKHQFGHSKGTENPEWWKQHVYPEDMASLVNILKNTIQHRKKSWEAEYRFKHANGQYRQVSNRGYILYGDNGAITRMVGAIQDVEEKKQYIEELKRIVFLSSHGLRRPVANMQGIMNLLNKENFSDPENKLLLELVEKVAHDMDDMLHQIVEKCDQIFYQTETKENSI